MEVVTYSNLSLRRTDVEENKAAASAIPDVQRYRWITTTCMFICFIAVGLASSIVGPTLVHMRHILSVDIATISLTFTFGRLGFFSGSLLCGLLYDRFNANLQIFLSTLFIGLVTMVMPWSNVIYGYYALNALQSFGRGYQDTARHPYMIALWSGQSLKEPMLQAMHAAWSMGCSIGPFIVSPFLVQLPNNDLSPNENASVHDNLIYNDTDNETDFAGLTTVRYSFCVMGLIVFCASFLLLIPYLLLGPSVMAHTKISHHSHDHGKQRLSNTYMRLLVFIQFFAFLSYVFYEAVPGELLPAFVIEGLHWSVHRGPWIASLFWASNAMGRIVNTPVSLFLSPSTMIVFNLTFTTLAFAIMLFCNALNEVVIWISVAMAGFAMSSTFASSFLWNSNVMIITGSIAGIFFAGSSIGGMSGSALAGYLFDHISHMWVVYLSLIACISHIVLFLASSAVVKFGRCVEKRHNKDANETE